MLVLGLRQQKWEIIGIVLPNEDFDDWLGTYLHNGGRTDYDAVSVLDTKEVEIGSYKTDPLLKGEERPFGSSSAYDQVRHCIASQGQAEYCGQTIRYNIHDHLQYQIGPSKYGSLRDAMQSIINKQY